MPNVKSIRTLGNIFFIFFCNNKNKNTKTFFNNLTSRLHEPGNKNMYAYLWIEKSEREEEKKKQ